MQFLAKFKKILCMGFRATLNFRKIKVALNLMNRIFLDFGKSCILYTAPFLKNKYLKLRLRVFLAGHTVAIVTYSVMKMITTCFPMIGQFFDHHDFSNN